jgi:TRAP-type uncharacterized transport system substrate-binding protein
MTQQIEMIEIAVEEKRKMERLILTLIDAPLFKNLVEQRLEQQKEETPERFYDVDSKFVEITDENIDRTIESEFYNEYGVDEVPGCVYEFVHQEIDGEKIRALEDEIRVLMTEQEKEYKEVTSPFGAGLSQKDFV